MAVLGVQNGAPKPVGGWGGVRDAPDPRPSHRGFDDPLGRLAGEPPEHPSKEVTMSGVRVLVGTRKGAFVLTSDGRRDRWQVSGPHFAGWEVYHVKGSPVDPNRIYASQSSGWFGQIIQRSDDGGQTWEPPGGGLATTPDGMPPGESNKFAYD